MIFTLRDLCYFITELPLADPDDDGDGFEDYASMGPRDNDNVKFVVGYSMDFEL